MDVTLLSPIPLIVRANLALSARCAAEQVERKIFGELATCRTNRERLDFWIALDEYVARNLANVEGHVVRTEHAGAAGG
jgi:hypothetical protein